MVVTKVAVLGATGQQGGSVLAALVAQGEVTTCTVKTVVAITRNPDSPAAKALLAKSNDKVQVEVRQADLNDVASLKAAFEGCDGAFVIANFWEGMNVDKEMEHYKNATDALKATPTIQHVVFSTLEETTVPKISDDFKTLHVHEETGPMKVPHFDGKARAEKYFDGLPTTFMVTSCYIENFAGFFAFQGNDDNGSTYTFTLPLGDKKIPWTILPDLGVLVASTLTQPKLIGQRIGQASFLASGTELAELFTKATGKTMLYNAVSWETFASFGFPGADELAQMFEFWIRTYDKFCAARSLETQREIMMGKDFTEPVAYVKTLPLQIVEYVKKDE